MYTYPTNDSPSLGAKATGFLKLRHYPINACTKETHYNGPRPRLEDEVELKKPIVAMPMRIVLDERKRGARFSHSSHFKSFSLTRASIVSGTWQFDSLMTKDIEIEPLTGQLELRDIER